MIAKVQSGDKRKERNMLEEKPFHQHKANKTRRQE
jgi:hypothetical protein